jgi:VanZ family protein
VKTHNVSQGKRSWQSARLSLVGIDKNAKKMWRHPHMIKLSPQNKGWQRVSQVFTIPPDAVELIVGIEIMNTTGTVAARKLELASVSENNGFSTAANSLLILWGVAFLWLGRNLHRLFSSKKIQGLFLIISASIAIGCCMITGKVRNMILDQFQEMIKNLKNVLTESLIWYYVPQELQIDLTLSPDKAGHFVLFAMLAFLVRIGRPQDRFAAQCFNLMLFAASTEVLQFYISGRQPGLTDWLIDVGGLMLGFFFAAIFRRRPNNR